MRGTQEQVAEAGLVAGAVIVQAKELRKQRVEEGHQHMQSMPLAGSVVANQ